VRVLNITLLLMAGMLVVAGFSYGQAPLPPPGIYIPPQTSVPFSGETTPSGIMFLTDPDSPPSGFDAGELYLYVNEARGWEQK
jgi:hypothetical protein